MKIIMMIMTALMLSGCATMNLEQYKDTRPTLKIEEYFAGDVDASGLFIDRFGNARKRFDVKMHGSWNDSSQIFQLVEDFTYDDGKTEQRIWLITKTGADTYVGSSRNAIGPADGRASGNAFHFNYKINMQVGDKTWAVRFDDRFFLQPDGKTMFNKITVTRWGFHIGDIYIFFRK